MKKRKKKLNIKKFIAFIFIVFLFVYLYQKYNYLLIEYVSFDSIKTSLTTLGSSNTAEYEIIKENSNSNYSGAGQKKVENKDGYFTTFTTIEKNKKTYKEYKQNGNSSWSSKEYWGGTMEENGCGITAISIILSGYGKNYTPEDLRKKYYPVLDSSTISTELSKTFQIKNSDFYYDSSHLSNNSIKEHLLTNRPILICVWDKPSDNRWTTASHYMVLLACDNNDMVYVSNPNGLENDSKSSGWYDINEITPYIAKALYIEDYN